MLRVWILVDVAVVAFCLYCLVDVITRKDEDIRHLPKVAWILLVLFFPVVGGLAWLLVGRSPRPPSPADTAAFPEYDRPGRAAGASPESDDEFLRRVRERAEAQREQYRRRQAEERAREQQPPQPESPGEDAG